MTGNPPPAPRRRRRLLPRLGIRGLMLLVLVAGVGLGRTINAARTQREAVAAIRRAGGRVSYSHQWILEQIHHGGWSEPRLTGWSSWLSKNSWLFRHVGVDYLDTVVAVTDGYSLRFDDATMFQVGRLRGLLSLEVASPGELTDAGLLHLAGLHRLRVLDLDYAKIRGPGLVVLEGMPELEKLCLIRSGIADADFAHVAGLRHLEYLNLIGGRLTDAGLASVAGLSNLEWFQATDGAITSRGLAHLRGLRKLKVLSLNRTRVDSLEPIRHLAGITLLSLEGCRVDAAGLAPVSGWLDLETVNLNENPIGDDGLAHLAPCTKITSLQINETATSDAGLARVAHLPACKGWKIPGAR